MVTMTGIHHHYHYHYQVSVNVNIVITHGTRNIIYSSLLLTQLLLLTECWTIWILIILVTLLLQQLFCGQFVELIVGISVH